MPCGLWPLTSHSFILREPTSMYIYNYIYIYIELFHHGYDGYAGAVHSFLIFMVMFWLSFLLLKGLVVLGYVA